MSSAVAVRPPSAIFREEQGFAWWVYAALLAVVALTWLMPSALAGHMPQAPLPARPWWLLDLSVISLLGLVLPGFLVVFVLRMTTEVTPVTVRVWFGWIPTYRQAIPTDQIARVETVRYRPIADFGFWGVRWGRDGERALHARGDRGVRLYLRDGSRLLIGSQRPEELAEAISRAIAPAG